jgi:hypothetical protein
MLDDVNCGMKVPIKNTVISYLERILWVNENMDYTKLTDKNIK